MAYQPLGQLALRGFGAPLVQPGANIVRGIGLALALVPRDENTTGDDARRTGQTDPLPDTAHAITLCCPGDRAHRVADTGAERDPHR